MSRSLKGLIAIFAGSGILHFAKPEPYVAIVPKPLPFKRELVYVSGAAEIACAAMLANARTRRLGGLLSAGLLIAVFPANVQMSISALRSEKASPAYKAGTLIRLPLQWPMIRISLRAARG